jgi:hypothetical protein
MQRTRRERVRIEAARSLSRTVPLVTFRHLHHSARGRHTNRRRMSDTACSSLQIELRNAARLPARNCYRRNRFGGKHDCFQLHAFAILNLNRFRWRQT